MRNILLSVLILPLLASCESQPTALDRSITEYRNSQWLLSEMWAGKSISSNQVISESQYMMGLCQFQRKQIESAETWFAKAKNSSNKEVSAKATAMLGIIAEHQGDYESAKADFAIASQNLTGNDRREANARATGTSSPSAQSKGAFTLQFGAYRNKENANAARLQLSTELQQLGIATTWVTEDTDRSGRILYLVQGGNFNSRTDASRRKGHGDLPQCNITRIN